MSLKWKMPIALGLVLAAAVAYLAVDYLTVDKCLDRGGRRDAQLRICQGARR